MNYIKYTVNGETVYLENVNGIWTQTLNAPLEPGNYNLSLEANNGNTSFIDSSDSRFNFVLNVSEMHENKFNLLELLPPELSSIKEFEVIMDIDSKQLNKFDQAIDRTLNDLFIDTMSVNAVKRFEDFLKIVGEGTLEQRKNYLKALIKKGKKLNEDSIRTVVKIITGSKAIIKFFAGNELDAPIPGQGTLKIQVLSPDPNVNYKFDDIIRIIGPLMPAHIKLLLLKYFSTWGDIKTDYSSWGAIKNNVKDWESVKNYIPPHQA